MNKRSKSGGFCLIFFVAIDSWLFLRKCLDQAVIFLSSFSSYCYTIKQMYRIWSRKFLPKKGKRPVQKCSLKRILLINRSGYL